MTVFSSIASPSGPWLELEVHPAAPAPQAPIEAHEASYAWPASARTAPTLGERLMALFYKLFTPTFEVPWLENFGQVDARLSRGAQPSKVGFRLLRAMGVDTVINLRAESDAEAGLVRRLGMRYHHFPCDPVAAPTHAQTLAFLHAATAPEAGRVFFHCYHGADRTGVFAACYRLAHDGWTLEQARGELDVYRFHHAFQQAKLAYLEEFAVHWAGLSAEERARVLHRQPAPSIQSVVC
jgi:protein tyrosine phosphatase (PTP) superfamily phosphohydrolase (DUF442 family)